MTRRNSHERYADMTIVVTVQMSRSPGDSLVGSYVGEAIEPVTGRALAAMYIGTGKPPTARNCQPPLM